MKLYVANVGVNKAHADRWGLRSPVFPDSTFEFVPIKEESRFSQVSGIPSYDELPSWSDRTDSLGEFLPERVRSYRAHADPEFETFTYGDIQSSRASNLTDLVRGDQLWFLARLWNHAGARWTGSSDFCFVGFIEVEQNLSFDPGTRPEDIPPNFCGRIGNNAHYRRLCAGDRAAFRFRVICGDREKSRRFDRALWITPVVGGLLFCGSYDESSGVFKRGGEVLRNKNGKPRRFDRFGSITRAIQCFLDSGFAEEKDCVEKLSELAAKCMRGFAG